MALPRSRSTSQQQPANPDPRADPEAARARRVALLARRDFASAELRAKLCSKGV